ncbi:hypothetical protein V5O48_009237 [Marasmius crinis-equi]|uniref:Uncharacterized protein n=1 Tax=Marasmius crinis-equi TaxID=585013 RepID=A0ABR3FBQ2_9AGAR
MSTTDLAATRNAIAKISSGKQVNEDSWMTMWCSTNWGELLQPAPLSIALLGSIIVIAASTDDFSLVNTSEDAVPYTWKYATHPGSFKACLMQMVGEGYTAFGSAHKNMTRIQNASSQLPGVIKDAINALLPDQIQSALDLAEICANASKESEAAFHGIWNLASEMVVACTNQVGTSQQKIRANEVQLTILDERKKSEETRVAAAKEANDLMKKAFVNAEDDFHSAVKNVPSGWDLVGMQAVESVTQLAVSAGNAMINMYTIKSQAAMAGIGMFQNATGGGPQGGNKDGKTGGNAPLAQSAESTRASAATITDPGALEVSKALNLASALQVLVIGGPNGGPDWDKIRGGNGSSGALYIQMNCETIKERLDTNKPISAELLPLIDAAVTTVKGIIQIAGSAQAADDKACDKYKPQIERLITSLQQLVTKANLALQQPGMSATGPATPPTPSKTETTNNAAKLAVENAKFQVDQTRANLEASRTSYNNATDQLIKQQEQISKTIASLTSLKLTTAGLSAMLPVLTKAVGAFSTLQAQFSQICQFFESVASLLNDVLRPSVDRWAKTMQNTMTLGGVKISDADAFADLVRQLIYTQMMLPLRVGMLSERIATTYLSVSEKYIMPAQRKVGTMMQFSDDTSEAGKKALRAKLETAQQELQRASDTASKSISALTFGASIDKRLTDIQVTLKDVLPAITQPVPKAIQDVTTGHIQEIAEKKEEAAKENPMFNVDDLM